MHKINGVFQIMFEKKDENIERFRDLTQVMASASQKTVPDNFTMKIMEKISVEKETPRTLSFGRFFTTSLNFGFHNTVTKTECSFYFMLTGFFYFILGLIMLIELPVPALMKNNGWLSFQPLFCLVLAAELTIAGIVLYRRGDSAIRWVRIGTVLYAALILLNFGIGALYIQTASAVFIAAAFAMTGLTLAVLLGLAIDHYHPGNIYSEA